MNEAILHLKNGQSRPLRVPIGREFQEMLYYMRLPDEAVGRTVRLQDPAGATIDVPANAIASLDVSPPHALIPDFLTDAELEQVWEFTLAHADAFQNSGVEDNRTASTTDYGIRRSRVLEGAANAPMAAIMMPKLQALMPKLWRQLRMNPLPFSRLECQITAHGEGDFFALHTDNGMPDIAHRRVSYVCYFHREPKRFSGGHLCLYDLRFQDGYGSCGRLAADIDPLRNGLMIFPSYIFHEVTPIQCASSALTDQRLTLNGWLTV